jgi:hypothetical protein
MVLIAGGLILLGTRLHRARAVKRPGVFLGTILLVLWLVSIVLFLVASGIYVLALKQQVSHLVGPKNPITPVTLASAVVCFFVIIALTQKHGFRIAFVSAIVGTIAAPLIFEFPFDIIVMWRTYPPTPHAAFTLLYFCPLFLIELASFALLSFSPAMRLSNVTLFLLAGLFLFFGVWAVFGFAYPYDPLPTALNMLTKVIAFAVAVSLFLPQHDLPATAPASSEIEAATAK